MTTATGGFSSAPWGSRMRREPRRWRVRQETAYSLSYRRHVILDHVDRKDPVHRLRHIPGSDGVEPVENGSMVVPS